MTEQNTRTTSLSAIPYPSRRKSRSRSCWFGCLWLPRFNCWSTRGSTSLEPGEPLTILERITYILNEQPVKMAHMLKVATSKNNSANQKKKNRRNSSNSLSHKGTGYGTGSTKSHWDLEKTVEDKLLREEHLSWLLNVLNAYMVGWPIPMTMSKKSSEDLKHMEPAVIKLIVDSPLISFLEYSLKNDSFFDVTEHSEIYQSMLETTACMSAVPELVPYLIKPYHPEASSIAKDLIPKFKENLLSIEAKWGGTFKEVDFRMNDFVLKITSLCDYVVESAREYEASLPPEERVQTAAVRRKSINEPCSSQDPSNSDEDAVYRENMKRLQLQTYKFIGDYGKVVINYYFKKEAKSINPYSPNLRERTRRIAKELASLVNVLPLNASNSIYVCYDDSRCDILKVLISGPDGTPYANGLFEFDVFFPTNYPMSPPKCAFLTTGAGNVRFNPNLYNDGKICLSILGTWEGRPEEKWNPYCSLLQVLISIQGLIFVSDPYFNEPGFEKYQGTGKGDDYSRRYNLQIEQATLNYAIREQLRNPPEHFKEITQKHIWLKRDVILEQARKWIVDAKKECGDDKYYKRKDSITFENGVSFYTQERNVQNLITDLLEMKNPFEAVKKNKE